MIKDAPGKQRENSPKKTTKQRVRSDGTSREHQVRLNEIIQQVQKDRQDAKACSKAGERWCDPMNIFSETGPSEPKDANAKADASDDDGWKSPFWYGHVIVGGKFAVVPR